MCMKNKNFVDGVAIIGKYIENDSYSLAADHDELWFGKVEGVSDEDKERLEELGWSEDLDKWHCFT